MLRLPFSTPVADWFRASFGQPTAVQSAAWPVVAAGGHCLISAGTGQGKSLAALLPPLDHLLSGADSRRVLYIAPLRALSNNMADGLNGQLAALPGAPHQLRIAVRNADTSRAERQRQLKHPPELLMTTPESLFVLLGSARGRAMLDGVRVVVVDEVHALLGTKRGAHLALSLERLEQLQHHGQPVQRIGLSATARPLRRVARYLGGPARACEVVAPGRAEALDLCIEPGPVPMAAYAHRGHWDFIVERICELAARPGKTLVFCNTRALVERLTARLADCLGAARVATHHGSMGQQRRSEVEQGLRLNRFDLVVCSASLELGIDVGQLERVCQVGQAASLNALRQRAGRSGHRPDQRPRIHLFPLTISDLLDAQALSDALDRHVVEPGELPAGSLDVLAQHMVAMAAAGLTDEEAMYHLVRRAAPWSALPRHAFDRVLEMLHHGYVEGRETGRGPLLRLGGGRLKAAEHAGRLALLNAGTLPEWFDYEVFDLDRQVTVGCLDEEFGFESSPGDVIQLGGVHFRIERIAAERIEVRACPQAEAALPFWLGEGAGRSPLLSAFVSRRLELAERGRWPVETQLAEFLCLARQQLGALPNRRRIVVERFFDPGGDEHLVIHAVFGQRINRAWGLALRKRFCRQFNFELQAAVTDNAILISLGATHSFDLTEVLGYLHSATLRDVLIQAVLDTPRFSTRLRWAANTALAIPRRESAGRVPAQIQRNQAENLIARIFPDQLACLENLSGPRRVPEHPLVQQALADCLHDHMDLAGLQGVYRKIERGRIEVLAVDTSGPSVLAQAAIQAPRHAFLDPAAAEERRTRTFEQASRGQHFQGPGLAQASPAVASGSDALEQRLLEWRFLPRSEGHRLGVERSFLRLTGQRVAAAFWSTRSVCLWVPVEALAEWLAVCPNGRVQPLIPRGLRPLPLNCGQEAMRRLALGAVKRCGRIDAAALARDTGLLPDQCAHALNELQLEGLLRADGESSARVYSERRPQRPAPAVV